MALMPKLEMRQGHALVMTPQLMQAIKLLQLSSLDLAAYVEEELERNPLLERAGETEAPTEAGESARRDDGKPSGGEGSEASFEPIGDDLETSRDAVEDRLGTRLDNVFPEDSGHASPGLRSDDAFAVHSEWASVGAGRIADGDYNLEAFVTAEKTLADLLAEQLVLAIADPAQRMVGQHLIDLVDESGYMTGDLLAVAEKLGAPVANIEAVLGVLQAFDPPGVCARNLTECLAIQLRELDRFDPAMAALVEHLELLAKRDFSALRKICGVDGEDLADMIAELKRLNPKPGLAFGSAPVQPIVPDVFVRQAPDGSFIIELNSDTLPKILLNQVYHAKVSKAATEKERSYLAERMQSANWLMRALDQRAKTILKVAAEIVKQQDAFFVHGVQHLRPLNLKTIADAISMHESTVSRVTANKYMATNRGIFELKYFFTSAIASTGGGEAHSAEAVRDRIRQMIEAEAAGNILSDDTIVEKLREAGVEIARRTVAKYRDALRIPSSVQRRREKQNAATATT